MHSDHYVFVFYPKFMLLSLESCCSLGMKSSKWPRQLPAPRLGAWPALPRLRISAEPWRCPFSSPSPFLFQWISVEAFPVRMGQNEGQEQSPLGVFSLVYVDWKRIMGCLHAQKYLAAWEMVRCMGDGALYWRMERIYAYIIKSLVSIFIFALPACNVKCAKCPQPG